MKLNKIALAVAALVASGTAAAEFSANIGATSNYIWRGVTQTDDQAAISGGLDYAHDSGFYAGTWASNVDFDDDATAEVDLYGGFHYMYPGEEYDFTEVYASLSFSLFTAGVNYIVDSEVDDVAGQADLFLEGDTYYYIGASAEVAPTWTVGGTVGYFDFDDDGEGGGSANDISYTHYQLDIGKGAGDFGDFTFSISKAEEESGDDDTKVFVSWAKTF